MACLDDLARRISYYPKDSFQPYDLSPYSTYSSTQLHSFQKFTQEHMEKMNINPLGFLWPDEEKLVLFLIKTQEGGIAWDTSEWGKSRRII